MSRLQLAAMARKHWTEFLPKKVAAAKKAGTLEEELQGAANLAQSEIEHLMKQGYQEHEAMEVALPKFILLKPEAGADLDDEQAAELAEMEAAYQKAPAPHL